MKITIELPDEQVKKLLDEAISRKISELSSEAITKRMNEVLATKFDRVSEGVVQAAIDARASSIMNTHLSRGYANSIINNALGEAAMKLLKERAK